MPVTGVQTCALPIYPIPVKKAMNLMGMEVGSLRPPLYEMGEENAKKLAQAMKDYGLKLVSE